MIARWCCRATSTRKPALAPYISPFAGTPRTSMHHGNMSDYAVQAGVAPPCEDGVSTVFRVLIRLCSFGVLSCLSPARCTPLPRPARPRLTNPTSPHIPWATHPRVSHSQPTLDPLHPRAFRQVCVVEQQQRTTRCKPSTSSTAPDPHFFGNPRTNHTPSASQPTHIHKFTHPHHPTTPNTNPSQP